MSYLLPIYILLYIWPFPSSSVNRVNRGYGDYNGSAGFHPGVDISPPSVNPNEEIHNVCDEPVLVKGTFHHTTPVTEWVILTDNPDPYYSGIIYEHIAGPLWDPADPQSYYFDINQQIGTTIEQCCPSYAGGVRHVHISLYNNDNWPNPPNLVSNWIEPGIADIGDLLPLDDQVMLSEVLEEVYSGIVFTPDAQPFPIYSDVIRGIVDFCIRPCSSDNGLMGNDSTGVQSILLNGVLRTNPNTGQEETISEYCNRTVFEWNSQLPDCRQSPIPPEYNSLYYGSLNSTQFQMLYTVTNCSNLVPGINGLDNIWVSQYNVAADAGANIRCRGAWDTTLNTLWNESGEPLNAFENSMAHFPDGKYLVNVSVTTHKGNSETYSLPVRNIYSDLTPKPVIVDNFIPYVEQVVFYTTYPDGEFHLLYHHTWNTVTSTTREPISKSAGYLPVAMGKSTQCYLGMAIHFSEPMDEEEIPAVWLDGLWSDEVQWSSMSDRHHLFFPSDQDPIIPVSFLSPSPQTDDTGHWVFYKTIGYDDPGYVGELRITIGENSSIPYTGSGLDLAGNMIDPEPETVDPLVTRLQSRQALIDKLTNTDSYEYGIPPEYSEIPYSDDMIRGSTDFREFLVELDSDLLEVEWFYGYSGDCPWSHGFWTVGKDYEIPFSESYIWAHISVVEPDGSYARCIIQSEFQSDADELIDVHFNNNYVYMNNTGDYLWFFIKTSDYDVDPLTPQAVESWWHLYCISREAECVLFETVFNGFGYNSSNDNETTFNSADVFGGPKSNFAQITSVEFLDSFTLRIDFWVPTGPSSGPPENGYYDFEIYSVPDPNSPFVEPTQYSFQSSTLLEEQTCLQLELNSNPILGLSAVIYSVPTSGHVNMQIFDLTGRLVQTLVNEESTAGNHTVSWNPGQIASGVYFVRLTTPTGTISTQAMVLR